MFDGLYRNRRVLLTGHTGFKGSWLALWLLRLGAEVHGIARDPDTKPSHWELLRLDMPDHRIDIRDADALAAAVRGIDPEIVFHLAAQPLVRYSYHAPLETWATNVMGTANLLEACRKAPSLKAIVVVTTDKCYENKESREGYREEDRLGGHDPYSASKASAELVVASYRDAFFKGAPLVATARAGNVIGGGDWAADRLIPDFARARECGETLEIRSPHAVRPWQHVLEPLSGYLQLGQKLLAGDPAGEGAWNFGPDAKDVMRVSTILDRMGADYTIVPADNALHETGVLLLDSGKAREQLAWHPVLSMEEQLGLTADWYTAYRTDKTVMTTQQLAQYEAYAQAANAVWAGA